MVRPVNSNSPKVGGPPSQAQTTSPQAAPAQSSQPIGGIPSPQPMLPETGHHHIGQDIPGGPSKPITQGEHTPTSLLKKSEAFYHHRWENKGLLIRFCNFFNRNIKANQNDMRAAADLPKPPTFNMKHILGSITDRALEDMKDFSQNVWRLLSLPLAGVAAFKTYRLKKANQALAKGKMNEVPQTPYQEKLQKFNQLVQQIDQLVDAAEVDYEKHNVIAMDKKYTQVQALNQELLELDEELKTIAAKEGLKYSPKPKNIQALGEINISGEIKKNEFKERVKAFKTTLKWYFAQGLEVVASVLRKVKHIPILGVIGNILAYIADALKAYLEGGPKFDEFKVLMQRYKNKATANKILGQLQSQPDSSKELQLIAKNIAHSQNTKSESLIYGKQIVDLVGLGAIAAGVIVGAIGIVAGGALAPVLAAVALHVSAALTVIALTMGAVYLTQRVIRWGVKLCQLARLEHKFQKTTDPQEKLKIAGRMLKKDGKKASFFLVKILQEENGQGPNDKKDPKGPVHDFLEKFNVLKEEDWELLNDINDDNIYTAARMLGKKLNIY